MLPEHPERVRVGVLGETWSHEMLWRKAGSGTPQLMFGRSDDLWSHWWVCRVGVGGGVGVVLEPASFAPLDS